MAPLTEFPREGGRAAGVLCSWWWLHRGWMCPALAVLGGSGHRGFSLLEEGPPCLTSGSLPDVVCGERNGLLLPGKARSRNFGGVRFAQNLL